jgi:prevent-host-death family protein
MTSEIPVTQARDELADLINRVSYGRERIILTRHSKPVACIVSPEDLARLEESEREQISPGFTGAAAAASHPPLIGGPMPVAAQHQPPGQPRG